MVTRTTPQCPSDTNGALRNGVHIGQPSVGVRNRVPSMGTRRRLPPEERRRLLIDAAIELYSRRPFEQVSVEDIAEAAAVSRALFYRYFTGPADIFAVASRVAIDGLIARLTAPRGGKPEEQLRAGIAEYIDFVEQHSTAFVAVVRNSSAISSGTGDLVDEVRAAIVEVINRPIR